MKTFIQIHPTDTVAVTLTSLKKGTVIHLDNRTVTLTEDIPHGHKFALTDISEGSSVIKYGNSIGITTAPVSAGSWIHTHNMKTGLGELLTYTYSKETYSLLYKEERFFQGYLRKDGRSGVRNEMLASMMSYVDICFGNARDAAKCLGYQEEGLDCINGDYSVCVDEEHMSNVRKHYDYYVSQEYQCF